MSEGGPDAPKIEAVRRKEGPGAAAPPTKAFGQPALDAQPVPHLQPTETVKFEHRSLPSRAHTLLYLPTQPRTPRIFST